MRTPWITRVAAIAALSLAACSAGNDDLLDSGTEDVGEKPDTIVTPDVVDVPDAADVRDASDVRDVVSDTPRDTAMDTASDVVSDVPRDTTTDTAPDVIVDVPRDTAMDVAPDVAPDVTVDVPRDTAMDVAPDVAPDVTVDVPRDTVVDVPADVTIDTPVDVAVDVPRDTVDVVDVAPDNGCGTRALCAGVCVDTQSDVRNCGLCGMSCPAPSNASATCAAGRCGFACSTGFHNCSGVCASNAAVATCGAACSPCAARANAAASCDGTACRYACNAGFADCDGDMTNGCERPVSSDVSNCGGCGTVCPGMDTECRRRTCVAGVCGSLPSPSTTELMAQPPRDCRRAFCDGMGGITQRADDLDLPVDGNACTDDVCASGVASNPPTMAGRGCGTTGMLCDGMGACVDCLRGSDCATGVCVGGRCQAASCMDGVRNGTETGVDCGGSCPLCPVLVVVAGGSAGVLAGAYDSTARLWSPVSLVSPTVEGVSVAVTPTGDAVGLIRYTRLGDTMDNRLRYTLFHAGTWAPFADIGPTVTTQGQPAVTPSSAGVQVVFHGFDYNHYFAAWNGTTWTPPAEATGASGAHSGALARDGVNPLLVFSNGLGNELYARSRAGTTWGGDQRIDAAATFDFNVSPAAVNLTSTTVLAVWNAPGGQLRSAVRTGGTWSAGANIASALSTSRVSLARLTDTQAILAFRGTDGNLYTATWATSGWAVPARVTTAITGVPSVARGVPGATAELAFLDGAGRVMHARLVSGAWSTPAAIGGTGLASVAIASGP